MMGSTRKQQQPRVQSRACLVSWSLRAKLQRAAPLKWQPRGYRALSQRSRRSRNGNLSWRSTLVGALPSLLASHSLVILAGPPLVESGLLYVSCVLRKL